MAASKRLPPLACVLAIGGLDPGGGAGILADVRAIAKAGAFGCAATTLLTVQSTSGMRSAIPVAKSELLAMCKEVVRHQRVRAFKVGALGSEENTRAIGDFLAIHRDIPAVVDTVMMPTRGRARLLEEKAVATLKTRILPRAAVLTVNAPEAEALTGKRVTRYDEAREAALTLAAAGSRAVLIKGGHLSGKDAIDLLAFAGDQDVVELAAPRLKLAATHGGGCILAAMIAGHLAVAGDDYEADPNRAIIDAIRWAKKEHHKLLAASRDVGGDLRVLLA